jgi:hypothetical protein
LATRFDSCWFATNFVSGTSSRGTLVKPEEVASRFEDYDRLDDRSVGSAMGPGDQPLDRSWLSRHRRFHRSVKAVAHPTAQLELPGLFCHRPPVANALDSAPNLQADHHVRHDWIPLWTVRQSALSCLALLPAATDGGSHRKASDDGKRWHQRPKARLLAEQLAAGWPETVSEVHGGHPSSGVDLPGSPPLGMGVLTSSCAHSGDFIETGGVPG